MTVFETIGMAYTIFCTALATAALVYLAWVGLQVKLGLYSHPPAPEIPAAVPAKIPVEESV